MYVRCGTCTPGLGATTSTYDLKRDALSATVAVALPALYHYKAPKRWKQPGKLGLVAAVVALYFATSFTYGKLAG
jgi:hypothetical protein